MNNRELWKLMPEIIPAIFPHYEPVIERFAAEAGWERRIWGQLVGPLSLEPAALSATQLQGFNPYVAAKGYLQRLAPAIEKGYVKEDAPGEYRLTDTGRTETQRLLDEARQAMAAADPLSPGDAKQLVALLRRLMGVSLATPPPPDNRSIRLSLKLMPALDPPLPYAEQALSCLAAYRDDAHLAAWRPSGLSAPALEGLTLLWRRQADSLETVCEKLAHRGHPPQVYAQALAELREREFIAGPDQSPSVTAAGQRFRDEIEEQTNRYFFGPWASLNEGEKAALADLLTRLRDGLKTGTAS